MRNLIYPFPGFGHRLMKSQLSHTQPAWKSHSVLPTRLFLVLHNLKIRKSLRLELLRSFFNQMASAFTASKETGEAKPFFWSHHNCIFEICKTENMFLWKQIHIRFAFYSLLREAFSDFRGVMSNTQAGYLLQAILQSQTTVTKILAYFWKEGHRHW